MRWLIPDSYSFVQAVIPLSSLYQEPVCLATDLHASGRPTVAMQPDATQVVRKRFCKIMACAQTGFIFRIS